MEAVSKAVNGNADRVPRNKKELLFKSRGVDVERASKRKCSVGYADLVIVWRVCRAADRMLFLLL